MVRFAFAMLVLIPALGACGNDHWTPDPSELEPDAAGTGGPDGATGPDAAPVDGAAEYTLRCADCHGAMGEGNAKGPQLLDPVRGFATYVVRHGRTAQMGFGGPMDAYDAEVLPDASLAAINDYLAAAPHPTDGQGLYVRLCANCHGADGAGGRVHVRIRGATSISSRVRTGHGGATYGSAKYMPAWSVTELSADEVSKIGAYVRAL